MHTTKKQAKKDERTTTLEEEECTPQQCESCNVQNHKLRSCSGAPETPKLENTGDTTNTLPRCLSLSARTFTECKQNTSSWMIYIECSSSFLGFFFRLPFSSVTVGSRSVFLTQRFSVQAKKRRISTVCGFETERQI